MLNKECIEEENTCEVVVDPFYYDVRQVFILVRKQAQDLFDTHVQWRAQQQYQKLKGWLALVWIFLNIYFLYI